MLGLQPFSISRIVAMPKLAASGKGAIHQLPLVTSLQLVLLATINQAFVITDMRNFRTWN